MSRLQAPNTNTLDEGQQRVHDTIASGPRGGVRGPLAVWLWRAELAERAQALGQYCRYDSSLPARLSELAILVTARHWSSEYEWQAHKKIGLEAGLSTELVDAIRTEAEPLFSHNDESVVYRVATTLLSEKQINQDLYDEAYRILGRDGLIDLVGVLGYYGLISMTINVFDIDAPPPHEMSS